MADDTAVAFNQLASDCRNCPDFFAPAQWRMHIAAAILLVNSPIQRATNPAPVLLKGTAMLESVNLAPVTKKWSRGESLLKMLQRRWRRQRRRRNVGRAYDMALEIARYLPRGASVLDVGCGNGFIAHHLGALLATRVMGIDVGENTTAEIDYMRFDGQSIPAQRQTFDAVLLCYVLHHAQDTNALLSEVSRVLRPGGHTIIYEDIPASIWDRFVCWTHDRKWRTRTGPCTFRHLDDWREIFGKVELEIVLERQLSRWRNLAHPVSRRLYVLRASELESNEIRQVIDATKAILDAVYVAA